MRLFALSSIQKGLTALAAAAALAFAATPTRAQDDIPNAGRLGYVSGNVSVEPTGVDSWGQAYPNLPLGPGDRIFTDASGRAEIQVGQTYVRVGPNTDITLVNENPSSIAFGLAQGSVHVHILGLWPNQPMQIHTPNANITCFHASDYRLDTAPDQSSTVYTNFAQEVLVSSSAGFSQPLEGGQSLQISGTNPPYPQWLEPAGPDDLDNWSAMRDRQIANAISFRYVSPYIPGAVELDAAGDWQPGTPYGAVWFPRNLPNGWAPYHYGHWVSHAPWGWMWVEDEPWGYAPFHYGRWVSMGGRWGWIPGPPAARPIFAPALVVFAGGIQVGGVGVSVWFPLGPGEPYRPWYPCPPHYVDVVNISNIYPTNVVHVQTTYVNIVNVTNVNNITYVNRTIGVTAMNQSDFAAGRPVAQAAVHVQPAQLEHVTVVSQIQVKPTPAALVGRPPARPVPVKADRPVLMNADGKLEAAKPGAKPVEAPVRPVSAPKPLPGRKPTAPPPGAKTPPAAQPARTESRPEAKPAPPPPAKSAPAPESRPAARPAPEKPEAHPETKPEAKPEARPGTNPAPKPAGTEAKPEDKQAKPPAKPGAKPEDKNKKPENKKPEDQKPQ
jgi:FecR protein